MSKLDDIFRDYQADVLNLFGNTFAPKKAGGSPERKKLLAQAGPLAMLSLRAEQEIKDLVLALLEESKQSYAPIATFCKKIKDL